MRKPLSAVTMAIFSAAVVAALVYLYYGSDLRESAENKLYDLRTHLAPSLVPVVPVVLLTINDQTAAALNTEPPLKPWGTGKPGDLSPDALLRIVEAVAQTKARMIAVVMPPQVFNYDDMDLDPLTALAQRDPRLILGTFDQSLSRDDVHSRPNRLVLTAADRMFKADIKRNFRRQTIRRLVLREKGELPYLIDHMYTALDPLGAAALHRAAGDEPLVIEINYAYKDELAQVPAENVVLAPGSLDLTNAVVLIGYTAYRPLTFDNREATYVNTPWQKDGEDVQFGEATVAVQAIGLINLLEHSWLKPGPLLLNILQTTVVATLALAAWQLSISMACLCFLVGWSVLLWLHALGFSYLGWHLALADAALWSALATLTGAFLRLRAEGRWRAVQTERLHADRKLAATQDQFLSRFAAELAQLNDRLRVILGGMPPGATASVAHVKAAASSDELAEYLTGMRQVGYLTQRGAGSPQLTSVAVGDVVVDTLRLFEMKAQEAKLTFLVSLTPSAQALADRTLVAQILYNLVSNAIKYSPPGSQIRVEAVRSKKQVLLRVSDKGPGIAAEFHDRIFEKFYRVKDDLVYKNKGHGLGLYLSRFFAKQMGADILLRSAPGEGAAFTLVLQGAPDQ